LINAASADQRSQRGLHQILCLGVTDCPLSRRIAKWAGQTGGPRPATTASGRAT